MRTLDPAVEPAAESHPPFVHSGPLCPHCGRESRAYLQTKDYNQRISSEDFQYFLCSGCGLLHLSPIPDDLEAYYRGNYGPYTLPASLTELQCEAEKIRFRVDIVQKFVRAGRLLEIGPSFGAFAFLAKQAGFEVDTIEMDARCCQFVSDVVDVNCIRTSDVTHALEAAGQYDVVALWHSIEHLTDPWIALRRISELLTTGGILVLSTPNPQALQFRVFGRFWVNLDAPRHLELIPASLLMQFMRRCGLTTVLATTTDTEGLTLNRHGWRASISHVLTFLHDLPTQKATSLQVPGNNGRPSKSNKTRPAAAKVIGRLFNQIVTRVLNPLETMGWRGSAYTVVFRKLPPNTSVS